jgi:hypothetical protein
MNWPALHQHKLAPPFVPPDSNNFSSNLASAKVRLDNEDAFRTNSKLLQNKSVQDLFVQYEYDESCADSCGGIDGHNSSKLDTTVAGSSTSFSYYAK